MDHELLRLECLKMAMMTEHLTGQDAIDRAQEIFDFLRVGADGASETRRIVAGMSNKHVEVRAVGGDINAVLKKPFTDYLPE